MSNSKTAFGAGRGKSILLFDPDALHIETDPAKPLYQRRASDPPDAAMVASIMERGVIEPVVVVRGEDGAPVLAAGTRRTIAAREANKQLRKAGQPPKLIPAVYRDEKITEALALKIIENAQREDLPLTAKAEEARLALTAGYSEEQVAGWFGVSVATIGNWRELAHLHPSVQKSLDAGTVRLVDAVRRIGKLPKTEQPAALSKLEIERPTRAARKAAGQKPNGKAEVRPAVRLRRFEAFADENRHEPLPHELLMFVGWLRGEVSDKALAHRFPVLAGMFEKRKEAK
jgi:ParB/RepB/Spo0J family partition protein